MYNEDDLPADLNILEELSQSRYAQACLIQYYI